MVEEVETIGAEEGPIAEARLTTEGGGDEEEAETVTIRVTTIGTMIATTTIGTTTTVVHEAIAEVIWTGEGDLANGLVKGLAVDHDEVEVLGDEAVTGGLQEPAVGVAATASTEVEAAPWKGHHGGIAKAAMIRWEALDSILRRRTQPPAQVEVPEGLTEDGTVGRGAAAGAKEEVLRGGRAAKRRAHVVTEAGAQVLVPPKVKRDETMHGKPFCTENAKPIDQFIQLGNVPSTHLLVLVVSLEL